VNPYPLPALVVEDDPSWQAILREILTDYGMKVDVAGTLTQAVSKMRATPYRLAIVDLSLTLQDHRNQDGLDVLESIKRHVPGCATLLLSGHVSDEVSIRAVEKYQAYTCLHKDRFRITEFRQVVSQALASMLPPTNGFQAA
jgi:DNA-binding NtrC family response regulator